MNRSATLLILIGLSLASAAAATPTPFFLPTTAADATTWPYPYNTTLYLGDLRAVVHVPPSVAASAGHVRGTIWWRRRDPNPSIKAVVVTTANGTWLDGVTPLAQESDCGIIAFPFDPANGRE